MMRELHDHHQIISSFNFFITKNKLATLNNDQTLIRLNETIYRDKKWPKILVE